MKISSWTNNTISILNIFKYLDVNRFIITVKILRKEEVMFSFLVMCNFLAFDVFFFKRNLDLFYQLNQQLPKSKSKIQPAKNSIMSRSLFKLTYKNITKFKKIIRNKKIFFSIQSNILEL